MEDGCVKVMGTREKNQNCPFMSLLLPSYCLLSHPLEKAAAIFPVFMTGCWTAMTTSCSCLSVSQQHNDKTNIWKSVSPLIISVSASVFNSREERRRKK